MKLKIGFTLAEVLITLGIIGVVAAITIPILMQNYQKKVLIAKAKQGHALLETSIRRYMADNGCDDMLCLFDVSKSTEEVAKEFSSVIKSSHICTGYEKKFCSYYPIKANKPEGSYKVDGKYAAGDTYQYNGRIYLPNGISYVIVMSTTGSCIVTGESPVRDKNGFDTGEKQKWSTDRCALIYMDTNGIQGPNQSGADIFSYRVPSNGKLVMDNFMKNVITKNYINYKPYNLGTEVK